MYTKYTHRVLFRFPLPLTQMTQAYPADLSVRPGVWKIDTDHIVVVVFAVVLAVIIVIISLIDYLSGAQQIALVSWSQL